MITRSLTLFSLKKASKILHQGGIIAYPTEAVFGLGCDPLNANAVHKVLILKQRSISKGLILVAADFSQLRPFLAPVSPLLYARIMQRWPGPTTWLLPANKKAPGYLRGNSNLQAVRVTAHPIVKQLCDSFGGAIVSTSANISKRPAARNVLSVKHYFHNKVDLIINGKTGELNQPSEIVNAMTGQIIRPGA